MKDINSNYVCCKYFLLVYFWSIFLLFDPHPQLLQELIQSPKVYAKIALTSLRTLEMDIAQIDMVFSSRQKSSLPYPLQ